MARFCVCERGFAAMFQVARGVLSVRQGSIDNTGIHRIVSDNRMRERISMKSKMLGALALLTLIGALFVMQSAEQRVPTVDAATAGSIDALNVGTCLTTSDAIFGKADCDLSESASDADSGTAWEVRKEVAEVKTLYATYAHDPKTSSDAPRAILEDSDLLKISIADSGRDKRTGVLVKGGNHDDLATVGAGIIAAELIDDEIIPTNTDIDFEDDTVTLQIGGKKNNFEIEDSGTVVFNFVDSNSDAEFEPADVDGTIRFFGCITNASACVATGTADTLLKDITSSLVVDEDRSSGDTKDPSTAPWLAVNASVPNGVDILVYAIYYETSDAENLVGGETYRNCSGSGSPSKSNGTWTCPNSQTVSTKDGDTNVVFTKDETDDNSALLVSASSDGDLEERGVDLYLTETKRFSGVYQGHLRLTDANGDGRGDKTTPMDWGRVVGAGKGDSVDNAAVLAVDQGPVIIEYRDSDGKKQTLRVEIDNVAPTINVAAPANGSSSDDQSPDFAGTIEDTNSGLADKSFRLVADNEVDGDGKNDDYVLDVLNVGASVTGAANTDSGITRISEYRGYGEATPTQFGIVMAASDLYDLDDDSCDNRDQCHILADEYDDGAMRGAFDDDLRLDLQDGGKDAVTRDKEFEIDFQAFVMDMAGNIGFSDSDPSNPRYINELGKKKADRKAAKHNILGYYSAHIITLDEKDPDLIEAKSATGYYGLNSDDEPIHDRSGIMVEFDGPIAPSSVSTNTFSVTLDNGSAASVVDVDVKKKYVFLKLGAELASDATPKIDIAQSQKVEDMAGNETFGKEQDEFEAKDGISPKLTITLSGGSGKGTGKEGPDKLTKDQITINVSSDEELQGAPRIAVVCSSLEWNEGKAGIEDSSDLIRKDIDDYVDNRSGAFSSNQPGETPVETSPKASKSDAKGKTYEYTCGYDENNDQFDDNFIIGTPASALARPGENWDYTWKDQGGTPGDDSPAFKDGALTVVAYGRDRSRYDHVEETNVQNWGSTSAEFTLDTELKSPIDSGDLQPAPDGKSKETRPFVLIEFDENTTVKLDSVEVDKVEVADQFEKPDTNRFVYWPLSLSQGDHEVDVEASDAAGNEVSFSYDFEVLARGDFMINLLAGWNAVSVPADPIDTTIGSVFTDPAVTTVIGWDTQGWRIAVRRDGVWDSNDKIGEPLNEIRAKYGYWVKSDGFIRQPVALTTNDRGVGGPRTPLSIDTKAGWNFVGVIDQDGDQTEDHFGTSLRGSDDTLISAGEYLGSKYVRAYTWDATFSNFEVLRPDNTMMIGDGVWVYYEGGIAP